MASAEATAFCGILKEEGSFPGARTVSCLLPVHQAKEIAALGGTCKLAPALWNPVNFLEDCISSQKL